MNPWNSWQTPTALVVIAVAIQGTAACDDPRPQQQNVVDELDGFPRYDENSPEARFEAICDAWKFPVSDGNLGGGGATAYADEDGLIPVIWRYTWRSTEPFADVWNFYAAKCGHDEQFDEKSFGVRTGRHEDAFYAVDDRLWLPKPELLASTFVYNAPEYVATIVLRPPTDERGTYIMLTIANRADDATLHARARGLHAAAEAGAVSRVKPLLDAGAGINDKDADGRTPLMIAAANGHSTMCQTLMLLGASATERDTQGRTALIHAAESGHPAVIEALSQMEEIGRIGPKLPPLVRALSVDWMILEGIEFESREGPSFRIAKDAQDNDGESALIKAAANGDMRSLRALCSGAVCVDCTLRDKEGRTALMHAVINGRVNLVRDLAVPLERHLSSLPPANLSFLDLRGEPSFVVQPKLLTLQSLLLRDNEGMTAVQHADERDDQTIADILHSYLNLLISSATAVIEMGGPNREYAYWERGRAYEALGDMERAQADFALAREAARE